ncbi:MAG: sigma 54-interacting transcriptional regulator [bacterium]
MTQELLAGIEFRDTLAHYLKGLVEKRDFAAAVKCYEDNRDMVNGGDEAWSGDLLHHVAQAYASLTDYPAALRLARTAQNLLAKSGEQKGLAELFATLGGILREMGEMKEAQVAFRDAESIFRRHDCPEGQARALNLLAGLCYRQSDFNGALAALLDAVAIAKRLNDQRMLAFMMGNIGRIYTFIGDLAEAKSHLELNIKFSTELGDQREATRARVALAYVLMNEGELDQAEACLKDALIQTIALNLKRDEIICRSYLGEIEYKREQHSQAIATLRGALQQARQISAESSLVGRIERLLADVWRASGDVRQAERCLAKAGVIARRSGDKLEIGLVTKVKALLMAAAGQTDQARRLMAQAIDCLDESGVRFEKVEALIAAAGLDFYDDRQRLTYLFRAEEFCMRNNLHRRLQQVERLISKISISGPDAPRKAETSGQVRAEFHTNCKAIKQFLGQIPAIGQSDLPLLLTGETGVGKDHIARHFHSVVRPNGPYVAVNCASLPATLLESELFGYHRGAFTGAEKNKQGLFVSADGGVLLLDEIGDMPLDLQTKLLGVLERRALTPLGATQEVSLDFKLVAATNQNLEAMVEAGTFRRDLYYRLSGIQFQVPALRHRKEDIPLLLSLFVKENGLGHHHLPAELVRQFVAYDWPGNARELLNKVKRLAVMVDLAADGDLTELSRSIFASDVPATQRSMFEEVERFERQLLIEALLATAGNKSEAARMLGIHEATVRTKLKRYGISLEGGLPS